MFSGVRRATALAATILTVLAAPAIADSPGTGPAGGFSARSQPTLSYAGGSAGAGGSARPVPGGPHPAVLPQRTRGRAALKALGSRVPSVARANGLSTARLTAVLSEDHTAWVSREGRLFYEEDAPAGVDTSAASTSGTTAATTVAPAYPTSQTFSLHSRPAATRKAKGLCLSDSAR